MNKSNQLSALFDEWKKAQEYEPDNIWKNTKNGNNITKKTFSY